VNLYLSTFQGAGTNANMFRPVGVDGLGVAWSIIDLRPNSAVQAGFCFFGTTVTVSDPNAQFLSGDRSQTIAPADLTQVEAKLGISLRGASSTVDVLREVLFTDRGAGRWRPVAAARDGSKEIILNSERYLLDVSGVSAPAILSRPENTMGEDNFERADETPIGGNWSTDSVFTPGLRLLTNALQGGSAGNALSYWNAFTPADDQFSQVRALVLGTNTDFGPTTRGDAAGSAYIALANTGAEGLAKFTAGTYTSLASVPITPNLAIGDILRLEVEGSTLRMYRNGILLGSTTDTSFTTGKTGVHAFPTNSRLNDWRGGDLTSSHRLNASGFAGQGI